MGQDRRERRRERQTRRRERRRREDAPLPVVRVLGGLILVCCLIAIFLGLSRHGEPIWKDARTFFLPAGIFLMIQSTLLGGRRSHPMVLIAPNPLLAPASFAIGLGLAALGLEQLDPARPWSLLTIPMTTTIGLLCLREAWRGKRSRVLRQQSGRWERRTAQAGLWMFGLGWPLFVLWALGLVDPN